MQAEEMFVRSRIADHGIQPISPLRLFFHIHNSSQSMAGIVRCLGRLTQKSPIRTGTGLSFCSIEINQISRYESENRVSPMMTLTVLT
jgi:hypothetical protein